MTAAGTVEPRTIERRPRGVSPATAEHVGGPRRDYLPRLGAVPDLAHAAAYRSQMYGQGGDAFGAVGSSSWPTARA